MNIEISFTDKCLDEVSNKSLCELKVNEIVYFEHDRPQCPRCGSDMDDNGSREVKPNKLEGIRKKQYICPDCKKTQVTSLEPFISKYSNYSYDICEKGLNYDYIDYLSYSKKSELIKFESNIKIARSTVYYHESEPTGYFHYDEVRQDRAFFSNNVSKILQFEGF